MGNNHSVAMGRDGKGTWGAMVAMHGVQWWGCIGCDSGGAQGRASGRDEGGKGQRQGQWR